MNADNCSLAVGLVSKSYIRQGEQALARRQRLIKALLSSRKLPEKGWDEATVEMLIRDCSAMDSNNFLDNVGVGEREGRVACPAVARRHFGLAHGIGRSGDVAAEQPKAAGSSLLAALTGHLTADALRVAGLVGVGPVTVLPLATGMTLSLVLLALRPQRPPGADVVVWSRIDQKTCLKAITAAGLRPHVVELRRSGDELVTDMQ
ncbi:O-phosphoseryl-tRNA(Sec) selenium transferase, partial [Tetrabaena socialis]